MSKSELRAADREHLLEAALRACRRAGKVLRHHFRSAALEVETKADHSPVTVADREAEAVIREVLRSAAPELGFLGEELGAEGSERDRWVIDPIDGTKNFVAGLPYFATLVALEIGGEVSLGVVHAPALGAGSGVAAEQAEGESATLGETWWALRGGGARAGTGTDRRGHRRRLEVSKVSELGRAFLSHGGLVHFLDDGLWPAWTEVVRRAGRTRGFGDWWGHVLVAEGRCDAMVDPRVAFHDVAAVQLLVEEAGGVFLTPEGRPLDAAYVGPAVSSNRPLAEPLGRLLGF